jgi:hypothetical protein
LVRVIHKESQVIHNGSPKGPMRKPAGTPMRNRSAAESYSSNNNHYRRGFYPQRNGGESGATAYLRRLGLR